MGLVTRSKARGCFHEPVHFVGAMELSVTFQQLSLERVLFVASSLVCTTIPLVVLSVCTRSSSVCVGFPTHRCRNPSQWSFQDQRRPEANVFSLQTRVNPSFSTTTSRPRSWIPRRI